MIPLIVLDTNVLVSGLCRRTGSASFEIVKAVQGRRIPIALTQKLCSEYEAVLKRSGIRRLTDLSQEDIDLVIDALIALAMLSEAHYLWRPNLPDESDNFVLEAAVATGATIVTKNLRDFRDGELKFPDLQVLTPVQFCKTYL